MQATWDKLEKNWMQFEVEVEAAQFAKAIEAAFKKLNARVTIPGFRPGKAPRVIFEQNYGKETLVQEAVEQLLPQAYTAAVNQHGVDPIDQPEIDLVQVDEGKPFIFKGKVQVVPEVTLGRLSGFGIERPEAEVAAEEIDSQVNALRDRSATLTTDESGEVNQGSFTVIDFEGFVDDEPFEGGKGENYTLEIGSGSFIPGFEEQLVGAKVGDARDVNVVFPEQYHAEQLAGKSALFKVTIKEVKRKDLPELNDDFAAEASPFKTLQELRDDIEKRLKEQKAASVEKEFQNKIVEAVAGEAEVEIPHVLIHNRVHELIHDFEQNLSRQGFSMELWQQATGKSPDDLHTELEEPAKKGVKHDLTIGAVAKQEGLQVVEADLEVEFDRMLDRYKGQEADIKKLRGNANYREKLCEALLVQKTVDHLVSLNSTPQG